MSVMVMKSVNAGKFMFVMNPSVIMMVRRERGFECMIPILRASRMILCWRRPRNGQECGMASPNIIELHEGVNGKPGWAEFASKLKEAMTDEYSLENVTVVLREMTADEMLAGEDELLTFNQKSQRFEFALPPTGRFPAAWKIADRIDSFLNPDAGGDG
jgi:hypothetical protein